MKNDRQLQQDVLAELAYEPSVHAAGIGVTVTSGVVMLSGIVHSYAAKRAAEGAAKRVAGVRGLAEELKVELSPLHQRDDVDIARAVLTTLEWDVCVPHEKIQVKVENGWVTLTGEVEQQFEKSNAASGLDRLTGVEGIANQITVKPAATASEIRSEIEKEFQRCAAVDASQIRVEVDGGDVTLTGTVGTFGERESADRAALFASGVSSVKNHITVS